MVRRLAVVLSMLPATASGCLLFTNLDDGYANGSAAPDAATEGSITAPADVASESSVADAGAPDGDDANVQPTVGCVASDASVCVDFDTALDFAPTSFVVNKSGAGTVAIEPGPARSAPNALHTTLPRREAPKMDDARAFRSFGHRWSANAHVEFWMYLAAPDYKSGDKGSSVADFRLLSEGEGYQVYLAVSAAGFGINANANDALGPSFPFDTWTHVVVDFGPTEFKVRYGATTLIAPHQLPVPGGNQRISVDLGPSGYNAPVPALDVRFDDVTVEARP